MTDQWNTRLCKYELQLGQLSDGYRTLKQITDAAATEIKLKLQLQLKQKELSELIPPVVADEFNSDYSVHTYQYDKWMTACVKLSESEYAVGCHDGSIHCRHTTTHQLTRSFNKQHTDWIYTMIIVGSLLVTGSNDKTIKVWDWTDSSKPSLTTLTGHTSLVWTLVHVTGKIVASGSHDKSIKLWDIDTSKCLATLTGHTHYVTGLVMFDSQTVLSVSVDSTIRLWSVSDISTAAELTTRRVTDNTDTGGLTSVLQLTKSTVVVGTDKGKLNMWDVTVPSGKHVHSFTGQTGMINQLVRLSPSQIASCSDDKSVGVWDIDNKTQLKLLTGHSSTVYGLLRLSNSELISVSRDKTIRVWGSK